VDGWTCVRMGRRTSRPALLRRLGGVNLTIEASLGQKHAALHGFPATTQLSCLLCLTNRCHAHLILARAGDKSGSQSHNAQLSELQCSPTFVHWMLLSDRKPIQQAVSNQIPNHTTNPSLSGIAYRTSLGSNLRLAYTTGWSSPSSSSFEEEWLQFAHDKHQFEGHAPCPFYTVYVQAH